MMTQFTQALDAQYYSIMPTKSHYSKLLKTRLGSLKFDKKAIISLQKHLYVKGLETMI